MSIIVLDRDGVINEDSDAYVKSVDEWIPIPGSLEAIARFYHAGFRVLIASNQSGLGRGLFTIDDLNAMHRKLQRELNRLGARTEALFFCPHAPEDQCQCRKPRPGLLLDIGRRLQVDLQGVPVIGDSLRDIQAARAVGARPMLVLTGKGERTLKEKGDELGDTPVYADLARASEALLSE